MKKLISMTDFVLEQEAENLKDNFFEETDMYFNRCVNYANLLKQPLKLGMFVPCDENNKILEYPTCKWCKTGTPGDCHRSKECAINETPFYNYDKSIEKIIFKNYVFLKEDDNYWYFMNNHKKIEILKNINIEYLVTYDYDTELTDFAYNLFLDKI